MPIGERKRPKAYFNLVPIGQDLVCQIPVFLLCYSLIYPVIQPHIDKNIIWQLTDRINFGFRTVCSKINSTTALALFIIEYFKSFYIGFVIIMNVVALCGCNYSITTYEKDYG